MIPSPWIPMSDPLDIKHIGKLGEETGELSTVIFRCLIQQMDQTNPDDGKINKQWLEEEIADVLANIGLCKKHFNLNIDPERIKRKKQMLKTWHGMLAK
jgi:NTP pyrophosphatase (non-canonical NTP hydrolase)